MSSTTRPDRDMLYDALQIVAYDCSDGPLADLAQEPLDQVLIVAEAAVLWATTTIAGGDGRTAGLAEVRDRSGTDDREEQQVEQLAEILIAEGTRRQLRSHDVPFGGQQ